MLVEANVKEGALQALRALLTSQISPPTGHYLVACDSWVSLVTRVTFSLSVWLFWTGIFYLLFFWSQHSEASKP